MAYNVNDIANKIIAYLSEGENGECISNLKLQKLLYYVQGYNVAAFNEVLFESPIEAWQYGPVVRDVYFKYKANGSAGINLEPGTEIVSLTEDEEELFKDVLNEYGQYSALGLMNMTHDEMPWKSVFYSNPSGTIEVDKLKEFFVTQLT